MNRCVVNVATGSYLPGQTRLRLKLNGERFLAWSDQMPPGSPPHHRVPYGFKSWAVKHAAELGYRFVLWADASILPIRSLDPLWNLIEQQGYWFSKNGWTNGEWCADSALPLLGITREEANKQQHVVATAFGLDLGSDIGRKFLDEYLRFAQNGAYCGPWWNSNHPDYRTRKGAAPCGDATVRGHRHDQTAASAIAAKLGMALTDPPDIFCYRGGETERTILVADANY